jgi:glycosyltransferase involved in cell wall biosynthesis
MKLNITNKQTEAISVDDDPFAGKGFSFNQKAPDTITNDGTAKDAKGGTELMREALFKYVDNELLNKFQIISSRVRYVDPSKPTVLWLHDTYDDPESRKLSDKDYRKQFKKLIFVSHHQMQSFQLAHGIPHDECVVLKNAIDPFPEEIKKSKSKINMIYHTTPHRGLELLYPIFEHVHEKLKEENIKIELDVYSSFNIYGWGVRDEPYKPLFEKLKEHEAINYHGFKPNDVIRKALKKAHIFPYPNIWPETSCIALMEAMAAGVVTLCPDFGALPETGANFNVTYPWTQDQQNHANIHANMLYSICKNINDEAFQNSVSLQRVYANNFYSWNLRAKEWEATLKNILANQ